MWDPENEEATLLISWSSRDQWKKIPQSEIDQIQEQFEKIAEEMVDQPISKNLFPLIFEGELIPQ